MDTTLRQIISFVVFFSICKVTIAQTYIKNKSSESIWTYTLYKASIDSTIQQNINEYKNDRYGYAIAESGLGFISKKLNYNTQQKRIDTTFFPSYLAENPNSKLSENKVTLLKTANNRYKHFIVFNTLGHHDYGGLDPNSPKDSIPIYGYFKIIDKLKPHLGGGYEAPSGQLPDVYFYEKYEKNYEPMNNWCTVVYPIKNLQNSVGFFNNGFKTGTWVFYGEGFSKVKEQYKDGLRNGLYTVYDEHENILYKTTFKDGTGIEKMYRDGSLYHIKHFKNGLVDFTNSHKVYHSNGKLAVLYDYPNNTVTKYYSNGYLSSTQQIITTATKIKYSGYYEGYSSEKPGELREKALYKNNQLIYSFRYDYLGKLREIHKGKTIQYFHKGKLVKLIEKGKDANFSLMFKKEISSTPLN
ncbi:hypothetical protein M4I21_12830 [Cellulophaga sp. 20_2_10]|uniref:hypothetical protein n=1 Tax=Cellulophaga sp. 20_2_10 TaxID=2942476 RepID=UPI00201B28FC|nr:hypothetical protein [Cellulophaga sp. 20_2_10]MCL5246702.1 hypothetical protein [Cellulophaga sp. 20_2_10]